VTINQEGEEQPIRDFRDFLKSLNKNNVEYLFLGGWAVGIYKGGKEIYGPLISPLLFASGIFTDP
jgi:hypothetical protein